MRNDKMPTGWRLIFYMFTFVCFSFTAIVLILRIRHGKLHFGSDVNKPYALKQNGDTLFIPTQVVVKHDTLIIIRTEERRPVQDSIDRESATISVDNNGRVILISPGGHQIEPIYQGLYRNDFSGTYKQRDTIYEHKIIYY